MGIPDACITGSLRHAAEAEGEGRGLTDGPGVQAAEATAVLDVRAGVGAGGLGCLGNLMGEEEVRGMGSGASWGLQVTWGSRYLSLEPLWLCPSSSCLPPPCHPPPTCVPPITGGSQPLPWMNSPSLGVSTSRNFFHFLPTGEDGAVVPSRQAKTSLVLLIPPPSFQLLQLHLPGVQLGSVQG